MTTQAKRKTAELILYKSDMLVELIGLKNAETGAWINAATTVEVVDVKHEDDLSVVAGVSFPLTMTYEAGSDGNWRATFPDTATVRPGQRLLARIDVNAGPGLQRRWHLPLRVVEG